MSETDIVQKIIAIAKELYKDPDIKKNLCRPKCASCLAAEARGIYDIKKYGGGFSSGDDIAMNKARDILATELNWKVY